jgi:hypothetical protein
VRLVPSEAVRRRASDIQYVMYAWSMPLRLLVQTLAGFCKQRTDKNMETFFWLDAFALDMTASESKRVADIARSVENASRCVLVIDRDGLVFKNTFVVFALWLAACYAKHRGKSFHTMIYICPWAFQGGAEESIVRLVDRIFEITIVRTDDVTAEEKAALLQFMQQLKLNDRRPFDSEDYVGTVVADRVWEPLKIALFDQTKKSQGHQGRGREHLMQLKVHFQPVMMIDNG